MALHVLHIQSPSSNCRHLLRFHVEKNSQEIAAIIYVTSVLLLISAFGFWIGLVYLNASAAVFGAAQLLIATVILALLFIPKVC